MTERITRLALGRIPGQGIQIGSVRVTVVAINGRQVRIAVEAPESMRILRCELPQKKGNDDGMEK